METYLYPKQINQLKDRNMINEDKLKGGKADKLTKKDIADKFGVTLAKINKELDMGVEVELETYKIKKTS